LLALATAGSGFCFSLGRYLRLPVRPSIFLVQLLASRHFFFEDSRLTLASDRGRGKCRWVSLCKTMAPHYKNHILSAVLKGSVAATQHPTKETR